MTLTAYLLQVSLALAGFAGLYVLLLQRETYYRWNRLYFWGTGILAFLLPYAGRLYSREAEVKAYVPDLSFRFETFPVQEAVSADWQWTDLVQGIWLAGIVWMSVRLLHQLVQLIQIRLRANVISVQGRQLLVVPGHTEPFSFFNWIFVHPGRYTAKELEEVIRHEEIHARQRHSFDVLLVEGMQIVLWFNPIVWWWGRAVRQNLEFLADHDVLASGMEARHYQYHLLRQSGITLPVANQFNVSELKNRIRQINTPASSQWKVIKLLGTVPMLTFLTMAFAPRQVAEQVERSLDVVEIPAVAANRETFREEPARKMFAPVSRRLSIARDTVPVPSNSPKVKPVSPATSDNLPPDRSIQPRKAVFQIRIDENPKTDPPLLILDGKELPYDQLRSLDPDTIEEINVYKDETARRLYGEKAKNGVLNIKLKKKE